MKSRSLKIFLKIAFLVLNTVFSFAFISNKIVNAEENISNDNESGDINEFSDLEPNQLEIPAKDLEQTNNESIKKFYGMKVRDIKIKIQGRYPKENLASAITVKKNKPLSLWDIERSIELLYRTGGIDNIKCDVEELQQKDLRVFFVVSTSPIIQEINFLGNKAFSYKKLAKLLSIKQNYVFKEKDLQAQETILKLAYKKEGFLSPIIRVYKESIRKSKVRIFIDIEEGVRVKLKSVLLSGNKYLSDYEILQIAKLGKNAPYRPLEVENARKNIVKLYQKRNYLEASVSVDTDFSLDKNHAIIKFNIEEGRIIDIKFSTTRPLWFFFGLKDGTLFEKFYRVITSSYQKGSYNILWEDKIRTELDIESEMQFSTGFADESAERIKSLFSQKGYDSPNVTAKRSISFNGSKASFDFLINPGWKIKLDKIQFRGHYSIETSLLKEVVKQALERFIPAKLYTEDAMNSALPVISDYFKAQGYLDVRISKFVKITNSFLGKKATLELMIEEGPRTLVSEVKLEGVEHFSEDTLKPYIKIKYGDPFDTIKIKNTIDSLKGFYSANGYIQVDIRPVREIIKEDKNKLRVIFIIDEGIASKFGRIILSGSRKTRQSVIEREITIETGKSYNPIELDTSRQKLYQTGLFDQVEIYPLEGDVVKDLVIDLHEKKSKVLSLSGGILWNGFDFSSESTQFDLNLESLSNNIFGLGHKINIRFDFASSVFPSFRSRGANETLQNYISYLGTDTLGFINSSSSRRIFFGYAAPHIFKSPVSASIDLTIFERQRLQNYLLYRDSIGFNISTQLFKKQVNSSIQLKATLRRPENSATDNTIQLWPVDSSQRLVFQASNVSTVDKRDNPFDPTRGFLLSFQSDLGYLMGCDDNASNTSWYGYSKCPNSQKLASNESFARIQASAAFIWQLSKWFRTELRGQGGYVHSFTNNNGAVPIESRFYLGGAGSLRGFSTGSLGPVRFREKLLPSSITQGWTAIPTGGNASFSYTLEGQIPLKNISSWFENWDFSLFHDGGNVFWTGKSLTWFQSIQKNDEENTALYGIIPKSCLGINQKFSLRAAFGVGLRWRTSMGPIRLDIGVPVKRICPDVEKSIFPYFSIGLL